VSAARPSSVVLDATDDLPGSVSQIEDWLLFTEPDSSTADATVRAGARAAGAIGLALREAAEAAPSLDAPNGHSELAPHAVGSGDLGAGVAALHRSLLALPDTRPPCGTFRALDLLCRYAVLFPGEDGAVLAAAAKPGAGSVRLSVVSYRAYERFARAALVDPLDRFAAHPPLPAQSCSDAAFDPAAGREVGL